VWNGSLKYEAKLQRRQEEKIGMQNLLHSPKSREGYKFYHPDRIESSSQG
jgi:hypothetical protein